jgi:Mrp family chromosome partitioning ATPase
MISPEEIESALHLPILTVIPHIERRRKNTEASSSVLRRINLEGRWRSRLLTNFPADAPAAAAYQLLVKDLRRRVQTHRQKAWLFLSSVAGEGTSLSCINLSIAAARAGIRTLVIEGHTRSPRISTVLGLHPEPGLTDCFNRFIPLTQLIQRTQPAGIEVLPAGHPVAYPETLWVTPAFHRLMAEARAHYDLVFFEGAPLLLYPDGPSLLDQMDGVVLVHQFGRTPPERMEKILTKLGEQKDRVYGVLLNDVPMGFH